MQLAGAAGASSVRAPEVAQAAATWPVDVRGEGIPKDLRLCGYNGITFDCGVPPEMGEDPVAVCTYLGGRDVINHVHYRNVTVRKPYVDYTEVWLDEGQVNMLESPVSTQVSAAASLVRFITMASQRRCCWLL